MTVRYVGPGGSDGASGTSWANRKLTLNGVEDTPVVAGDTVYVAPGIYRETLTCDVSGSSGNIITYIADITGENTDGVGGIVRITGSDDDSSATRATGISIGDRTYREFRGFRIDSCTSYGISINLATAIYLYDLVFSECSGNAINLSSTSAHSSVDIARCYFGGNAGVSVGSSTQSCTSCNIYNCIFVNCSSALYTNGQYNWTVKNCTIIGGYAGYQLGNTTGTNYFYNNIVNSTTSFYANGTGRITENYNIVTGTRTNTSTGANSIAGFAGINVPIKHSGYKFGFSNAFDLASWSYVKGITGSSQSSTDFYNRTRPTTAAKISWGAVQYDPVQRETTTTYNSGATSINIPDAGRIQLILPTTNASTTVTVYVYREADYAGTLPQMIIRQPGQSERTTVDTGSSGQWNQLTDTFTPVANPPYVVVELVSNNTATSGNYDVFFDDIGVS